MVNTIIKLNKVQIHKYLKEKGYLTEDIKAYIRLKWLNNNNEVITFASLKYMENDFIDFVKECELYKNG